MKVLDGDVLSVGTCESPRRVILKISGEIDAVVILTPLLAQELSRLLYVAHQEVTQDK